MPRPNRYHPYTRDPKLPSSRYSPTTGPTSRSTRPKPINIKGPLPLTHPYQYIPPEYIRGVTTDGKSLIARSIIQSADGILHVQMQIAPFPSEQASLFAAGRMFESPSMSPSLSSGVAVMSPRSGANSQQHARKDSATFSSSQDGGSEGSVGEQCPIVLDGEDADAEGETEDSDLEMWRPVVEQRTAGEAFAHVDFQMQLALMGQMAGTERMR